MHTINLGIGTNQSKFSGSGRGVSWERIDKKKYANNKS